MQRYILVRFVQALVTLWLITVIVFVLTYLVGSPVHAMLADDASPAQVEALTRHLGLDRPLIEQYLTFLGRALQGDFGGSIRQHGKGAMTVVLERLPATLRLGGVAILLTVVVAVPLGVLAAVHKDTFIDSGAKITALLGQSIPPFWLGIILIWVFAVGLGLFPTSGIGGTSYVVLPAVAMSWYQVAALVRLTRSSMLEVLDTEYVKLARVKGVPEWKVVWKHALRNAAIVPLTYFGILAGSILTGSIVIETVFAWPGVGHLAIEAIRQRDYPVVQAVVVFFALVFLLLNFLVDILYAYVDPRIRHG